MDTKIKVLNSFTKKQEEHTLDECKLMEEFDMLPKGFTAMVISNLFFEETPGKIVIIKEHI